MKRLIQATHRADGEDAGIAMIFTIFLILVITITSVSLVALLLSQVKPTGLAKKQVRTVDAASAGMQAALGQLRNTTTAGVGDLTKLPCSDPVDNGGVNLLVGNPTQTVNVPGDSISGTVQDTTLAADEASYKTYLVYYATDPTSHETDSTTSWWSSHAIGCKAGIVKSVPSYAFIQSFGTGAGVSGLSATQGNRTQHAIYQFSTTTGFTVGGRMAEYNTNDPDQDDSMCLDTGSASPAVNTIPVMQPCQALGLPQQTWQYRNDLSIFYGGNTQLNLCLQMVGGTSTGSGTAKYYTGGTPELETCAGTGYGTTYSNGYSPATMQLQEWGFNDNGHMSAPIANGDVTESSGGACLQPNTSDSALASAGTAVIITSCSASTSGDTAWNPDAEVGAGKALVYYTGAAGQTVPTGLPASSTTSQYVNFAEFGRCLDVTGQSTSADHLIAYPCKQAPDSCKLTWNQVWSFATSSSYGKATDGNFYGEFKTSYGDGRSSCAAPGTDYCLTAPSAPTGASGYGGSAYFIQTTSCGSTPTAYQLWDATGLQANYAQSYLLVNKATGLCMAADPSIEPTNGSPSIVATACDGSQVPANTTDKNSLLLKWNAPPYNPTPGLSDIQEDGGSVNSTGGS